ncbi:flagellar hook-basal body complex protein FliE [Petrocella sp. FN5]|uniref:flagellar hook-basal body complex protein FliE n=1 Tax=Petrocella sp. FN5 TaxID=3032002 RepID=UPI0023DBF784|nr:flagellar hook-basal body complex protein FliE [Petrocella sp. FN5]MDF1616833.1 flagellar hook-basal body complex protein FliE [Petrocella sp. FN5]
MNIQPVNQIQSLLASGKEEVDFKEQSPFKALFQAAMNNIEGTNNLTKKADQMSLDFAVGKIDNIADVMVAQEKASIALQYTVQLRNKLLDAYNEIMRIQI